MTNEQGNRLRHRWAVDAPVFGGWVSTPSLYTAEAFANADMDYVCVDMQHGMVDYIDVVRALQALRFGASTALVRVPDHSRGLVGKVLDAGAEGVIFPMVNTAAEAEEVVGYVRYAPEGSRSYGPIRSSMIVGSDTNQANAHNLCIAMIETVEGVENADAICATPGVDAIYIGPADLAVSMGIQPRVFRESVEHLAALHAVRDAGARAGKPVGIHCPTATEGVERARDGFAMMTIVGDAPAIAAAAINAMAEVKGGDVVEPGVYG